MVGQSNATFDRFWRKYNGAMGPVKIQVWKMVRVFWFPSFSFSTAAWENGGMRNERDRERRSGDVGDAKPSMRVASRQPAPQRTEGICVTEGCGAAVRGKLRCRRCY